MSEVPDSDYLERRTDGPDNEFEWSQPVAKECSLCGRDMATCWGLYIAAPESVTGAPLAFCGRCLSAILLAAPRLNGMPIREEWERDE